MCKKAILSYFSLIDPNRQQIKPAQKKLKYCQNSQFKNPYKHSLAKERINMVNWVSLTLCLVGVKLRRKKLKREKLERKTILLLFGMRRTWRERLKKGGTYTFFFSLLACEERRKKWNNILIFQFCPYTSTKPFSFTCYMLQRLILEL